MGTYTHTVLVGALRFILRVCVKGHVGQRTERDGLPAGLVLVPADINIATFFGSHMGDGGSNRVGSG
jgi:hypothetical protein